MKGLPNLIRLHRWRLDEKRRRLTDLERLAAELRERRARLAAELRAEQEAARSSIEGQFIYGSYARAVIERREKLAQSIASAEEEVAEAAAQVTEAFQELKRFELAQAQRERAVRARAARIEQALLDETGLERYRRGEGA